MVVRRLRSFGLPRILFVLGLVLIALATIGIFLVLVVSASAGRETKEGMLISETVEPRETPVLAMTPPPPTTSRPPPTATQGVDTLPTDTPASTATATATPLPTATSTHTPTPAINLGSRGEGMDLWTHASTRRGAARLPILPAPPLQATPEQTTFIAAEYPAKMKERALGKISVRLDNRDDALPMITAEIPGNVVTSNILGCHVTDTDLDLFDQSRSVLFSVDLVTGDPDAINFTLDEGVEEEQELDSPPAIWDWKVETTAPGPWEVSVDVTLKVDGKPKRCIWPEGRFSIGVRGTSFFRWGMLGIGSILGGFLGSGFTIPFLYVLGKDWWAKRPKKPPIWPA